LKHLAVVVPLVDAAHSYGGPVTVAAQQVRSLRDRYAIQVFAPVVRGDEEYARSLFDAETHTFAAVRSRRVGMSSVFSPHLLKALRYVNPDVAHVHMARDLTLPLAARTLARKCPTVIQTHGMVMGSSLARSIAERVLTTPALRGASTLLWLTEDEHRYFGRVAPDVESRFVANGVDVRELEAIAATAQRSDTPSIRIGYVSRLARRKRPELAVDVLVRLRNRGLEANLTYAGADEGSWAVVAEAADAFGVADYVEYRGALARQDALRVMSECDVILLPAMAEPFPMAVIESLAMGIPAIVTDDCGLAPYLRITVPQLVAPSSPEEYVAHAARLSGDAEGLLICGRSGQALARSDFDIGSVAVSLDQVYSDAMCIRCRDAC
jgi:glycosyltransferase involved in cell wall biosynthesis